MDLLEEYKGWLRRRGASDGTVKQYGYHAKRLLEGGDIIEVLTDRKLSPKYRRMCRAAASSFAKFRKDDVLLEELAEVRLPAAVRQQAKVPLSESAWRVLRGEIADADYITEPMRGTLGLIAARGLRRGDVLRLKRSEVSSALEKQVLSYLSKGERRLEFGVIPSFSSYLEILHDSFSGTRAKRVCDLVSKRGSVENRMEAAGGMVATALRKVAEAVGPKRLGIKPDDLHPHQLRRTYASLYYEACGHDPMKLKQHMQWASIETAMGYVDHSRRDELDDIATQMMK
jgi:integrase